MSTAEHWSGRLTFILASVGAAVGLGNIWKFPYTVGNSGGSAFVLVYVLAILLIATPIMLSEMMIGRHGRASAPTAMQKLALASGSTRHWGLVGWMGVFGLLLVLSFYSVIAGWTIAYLLQSVSGGLAGLTPDQTGAKFGEFLAQPGPMILWHLAFTAATVFVVARGVKLGLERFVKVLMPALFVTLIGLVIYAAIIGDFAQASAFLFTADLSKLTAPVVLAAVGQAFFSVNVGVGAVLTYSAYLPKDVNLFRSAITISLGDTLVALLAGLAIFPIVFAYNMNPAEGPGLIFVTLSAAFATMPGGSIIGAAFFLMILFAALTSSISMLETMTARAAERPGLSRARAATAIGACTFVLGLVTVFSFSSWSDVHLLGQFAAFEGKTPFDLIDYFVSNLIMPIAGVLYAVFASWILSREVQVAELGVGDGALYKLWLLLARYIAPVAIAAVFYFNL
ncbi:MAG: sodium-dependent transporter [Pseudomonadales bacterium]